VLSPQLKQGYDLLHMSLILAVLKDPLGRMIHGMKKILSSEVEKAV